MKNLLKQILHPKEYYSEKFDRETKGMTDDQISEYIKEEIDKTSKSIEQTKGKISIVTFLLVAVILIFIIISIFEKNYILILWQVQLLFWVVFGYLKDKATEKLIDSKDEVIQSYRDSWDKAIKILEKSLTKKQTPRKAKTNAGK